VALLLHAIVHPADMQDRDGGILLLWTLFGLFPFLKKLFADGGYQGPQFQKALARILPELQSEIVKRSDQVKGFAVLPKRWIVERTFAWLSAAAGSPRISKIARIEQPCSGCAAAAGSHHTSTSERGRHSGTEGDTMPRPSHNRVQDEICIVVTP
jgi:transposase